MTKFNFLKLSTYPIAFFFLGAYSIVTQVLLIREFLVIFFGNELCMGIIFSGWLLSIFIGAILGGRVVPRTRRVLPFFILFQYIIILLPSIQIILVRNLRLFLHIPIGEYIPFFPMIGSIFSVLFPFSFFIGFIFPFAISIYPQLTKNPPKGIGTVYIYESLGSTVGSTVLTFYLILHFSPFQIIALFILLILINSFFLIKEIKERVLRITFSVFCLLIVLVWAALTYCKVWNWIEKETIWKRWKTINPQIDLVESTNSPYQNIVVAKMLDQYSLYGNGQILASFPDPYQSATRAHFLLSEHPHPERVLLIGGGICGLMHEILKHPVKTLHYVELDAMLIEVAQKYLTDKDKKVFQDHRVQIFLNDGRNYVKNCRDKYDLVLLDLPDPSTAMLNRFYTLDFFKELNRILKPDGLLVTGVNSSENFIGPEIGNYTASIYHSLTNVFPHILVTPGDYNYFFASRSSGIATADTKVLAQRYVARKIKTPYFSEYNFKSFLPPERVKFINKAIQNISISHPNTDERPVSYFYNLVLWDLFSGGQGRRFFQKLEELSWGWYFLPLGLILVIRFIYLSCFHKAPSHQEIKFNSLYAIFTTGFAAMGLEIILIFTYQNHYGCLYQKIGIIVGLFMAGLTVGAQIINRQIGQSSYNWPKILLGLEAALTGFSLLLPFAFNLVFQCEKVLILSEPIFMALIFGAGLLTGSEFPLVNEILIKAGLEAGRSAGVVDGYDHLGACLGGALTGTILVPLLGTIQSCLFVAGLNFISCLFLIFFLIQKLKTPNL